MTFKEMINGMIINPYKPEGVKENEGAKVLRDFMIQCDHQIEHRRPDIILIEKESKQCWIIDIACPADNKVCDKI